MSSAMAAGAAPITCLPPSPQVTYLWDVDEVTGRTKERTHPELEPPAPCSEKDAAVATNTFPQISCRKGKNTDLTSRGAPDAHG